MDKTIVLKLGGQDRTLNFGVMGFLKHLGKISGEDPVSIFSEGFSTDPGRSYKVHLSIIHAGILANCDVEKVKPEFTAEDVDNWVSCLSTSEVEGLVLKAFAAMTGKTVEELKNVIAQAAKENGAMKELVGG